MISAVFACGHWRRRDPLAGLTPRMRAAISDAGIGPLQLAHGAYSAAHGMAAHAPATVRGLAERGLMRLSAGPEGAKTAFRLTDAGKTCAAELQRRAGVRRRLGG